MLAWKRKLHFKIRCDSLGQKKNCYFQIMHTSIYTADHFHVDLWLTVNHLSKLILIYLIKKRVWIILFDIYNHWYKKKLETKSNLSRHLIRSILDIKRIKYPCIISITHEEKPGDPCALERNHGTTCLFAT